MITEQTTFQNIMDSALSHIVPCLVSGGQDMLKPEMTLQDLNNAQPTWNAADMAAGLNRLNDLAERGTKLVYPVYSEADVEEDPTKAMVSLVHCPADGDASDKPFILVIAGGAYGAVANIAEAFPVSAQWNALGFTTFCLSYRVRIPNLFPKPLEDVHAALQFIRAHAETFGVNPDRYLVSGYSAGGHITACWGLDSIGCAHYGDPKPEALFLAYPVVNFWDSMQATPEPIRGFMVGMTLSPDASAASAAPYNVDEQMTDAYPPFYHVQALDDPTVPAWNADRMETAAEAHGIRHKTERVPTGQHGFGAGTGTPAEGWTSRAIDFWKTL